MSNIKLTLTHEGAEALREFARALPVATENIQLSTEKLYAIYQSVVEDLGVHKQEFENLLSHIKKMQLNATYAIAMLVPNMNKTADRIDDYVAFDPTSMVSLSERPRVDYFSRTSSSLASASYINRNTYTPEEVAQSLGIYSRELSVAYSKDSNNPSKIYHELSDSIFHPKTGEKLKAVKGYYISKGNGQEECVYAEFVDDKGVYFSYTKCMGDSVLSQMRKDGIFGSKTEGLVSDLIDKNKKLPWALLSHEHSYGFDLRMTNRNYNTGERKWRRNCQRCVPAYEMRRRGYNVQAKPRPSDFPNPDYLARHPYEAWEKPNIQNTCGSGKEDIEQAMKAWGDGSRAQVVVYWAGYKGGHTFVAAQIDGLTHFIDPQNENYDASSYFNEVALNETTFCRIDNLEPSVRIKDCCEDMRKYDNIRKSMYNCKKYI